jgi:hypothetical protein
MRLFFNLMLFIVLVLGHTRFTSCNRSA